MLFQFHKGTIRTIFAEVQKLICNEFQFHKGTIRTPLTGATDITVTHFNSIKVRLEQRGTMERGEAPQFQFHKGTIRTLSAMSLSPPPTTFQFHKGTIRT